MVAKKKAPKEGFRIDPDEFWGILEFAAMGSVEAKKAADALTVRTCLKRPAQGRVRNNSPKH